MQIQTEETAYPTHDCREIRTTSGKAQMGSPKSTTWKSLSLCGRRKTREEDRPRIEVWNPYEAKYGVEGKCERRPWGEAFRPELRKKEHPR
jgi:hypothetical protein